MEDILQKLIQDGRITELREYVGNLLREGNWSGAKKRLKTALTGILWYKQYIGILRLFEIDILEGIDLSAEELLDAIPSYRRKMSFEQIRNSMLQRAGELIQDQLKQNGSTLFFDLEALVNTEFVNLVPKILELRQQQFVSTYNNWIANEDSDLQKMMLTHYGNEILQSLEGNITKKKLSVAFQKVIDEIGSVDPCPWTEINMSEEFKKLVIAKVNFAAGKANGHVTLFGLGYPKENIMSFFDKDRKWNFHEPDIIAMQHQAVDMMALDTSPEITDFLIKIVYSIEFEYSEENTYCYPVLDVWDKAVEILIARNEGESIVSKLENIVDIRIKFSCTETDHISVAAKHYAKILGDKAYSKLWRNFPRCGSAADWFDWDIYSAIRSIGPSIDKQLFNDALMECQQYFNETYLSIIEGFGPQVWDSELGMANSQSPEAAKRLVEYIAKHDKNRALRELCYSIGGPDGFVYSMNFDDILYWIKSMKRNLNEDALINVLSDSDSGIRTGAMYCLGVLRSEKGLQLMEGLIEHREFDYDYDAINILVRLGYEPQILKVIEYITSESINWEQLDDYNVIEIASCFVEFGKTSINKLLSRYEKKTGTERRFLFYILDKIRRNAPTTLKDSGVSTDFIYLLEILPKSKIDGDKILTEKTELTSPTVKFTAELFENTIRDSEEPWLLIELFKIKEDLFCTDIVLNAAIDSIPKMIDYMKGNGNKTGLILDCISEVEPLITDKTLHDSVKATMKSCRSRRIRKGAFTQEEKQLYAGLHSIPSLWKQIPLSLRKPGFSFDEPLFREEKSSSAVTTTKPKAPAKHGEERIITVDEQQKSFLIKRIEELDVDGVREKLDYITWLYGWYSTAETLRSAIVGQSKVSDTDIVKMLRSVFSDFFPSTSNYLKALKQLIKCPDTNDFNDVLKWVRDSKRESD